MGHHRQHNLTVALHPSRVAHVDIRDQASGFKVVIWPQEWKAHDEEMRYDMPAVKMRNKDLRPEVRGGGDDFFLSI